jgi:adhesin transport system outer membrane protein
MLSKVTNKVVHFIGFCAVGFLTVAPAHANSLQESVVQALNHHPSVEAAVANRDALRQERREQWANHFPTLNIRGAGGRVFGDNSTSRGLLVTRGSAYSYLWEGSATLTQPLFNGFETFNRVKASDVRVSSAQSSIAEVRESLALSTVLAYMDVLRASTSLASVQKHDDKIDDYIDRIGSMVEQGGAEESMSVQAKDIGAQLKNTYHNLKGQSLSAEVTFSELTGFYPDETFNMPPSIFFKDLPDDVEIAVSYALEHHPSLRAAQLEAQALKHDVDADKQFYYPDFDGELSYLKRDQREEIGGEATDAKAVVRVNWDLSVAGGQAARVRQSKERARESLAQQEETKRRIERDVRIAYNEIQTAQNQLMVLKERRDLNVELVQNYNSQFEAARINLLQLLQSENALFNTELSLKNGTFRHVAAKFNALASMGVLQNALGVGLRRDRELPAPPPYVLKGSESADAR